MHPLRASSFSVVVAAALALLGLLLPSRASATSCEVPQLETSKERADVIFVGTAGAPSGNPGTGAVFSFRVERVFKGTVPAAVHVGAGGLKGAGLSAGNRFLVFGILREGEQGEVFAHLCGGTQRADGAKDWIDALGPGVAPAAAGTRIASGKQPTSAPSAPAPVDPPAPVPTSVPTPDPPPVAAAAPPPAKPAGPPPSAPPPRGGCAGCTAAEGQPSPPRLGAALAWIVLRRRRKGGRAARATPALGISRAPHPSGRRSTAAHACSS